MMPLQENETLQVREPDADRFETMRSLEQDLTFESAHKEFEHRNVELDEKQMRLMNRNGLYTNLAFLLSDQCTHSIKMAVFQGTNQFVFKDRHEFSGSLFRQMNEVYEYIDFRNRIRATIEGLDRIDVRDYPEVALREALFNLLIHRDYSYRASALISMYDDRIEFISMGGLMPGVELEDIMAGISVCRNQDLADVFYRLRLIEAYGTGINKIFEAYEGTGERPRIETTKNTFKVILPNVNFHHEKQATQKNDEGFMSEEDRVLAYLSRHGSIDRNDVAGLLDVSISTAARVLRKMVESDLLERSGKARNTRYTASRLRRSSSRYR